MSWIGEISESLRAQDLFEWVALLAGIVYVVLAARNNMTCWLWGILSCSLIAYKDFTDYLLYADGGLQIFYVIAGFVGIYQWRFGGTGQEELPIAEWTWRNHRIAIATSAIIALIINYLLINFTAAQFTLLDSLTTVFSVLATLLLIRRIHSNWIYWIVIDAVYIYLFISREGFLIALLFAIYAIVAIHGYLHWRHLRKETALSGA